MKNMKNIYHICICLMTIAWLTSCSDQLDVNPTSVITTNSFWETEGDAQGALVGMYVNLRTVAGRDLYYLGEARSDVLAMGTVGEGGWAKYYNQTLIPEDAGPSWQSFYTLVNSANLILKYVPEIEFTSEDRKNDILAQAYTMRAFTYFVMTKTWGRLPLRTEPIEGYDAETTQKERVSEEEVFELIKQDIDQALQLFPDNEFDEGRNMWSRPAANALKADVYLWTAKRRNGGEADLNTALSALNEVETASVSLLSDYEDIFEYENKGNEEIVMSVRFEQFEASSNYFYDMYLIASALPTNITDSTRNVILPIGGNNIVVPSASFKAQFSENDTRKDASFFEIYTNDETGTSSYFTTIVLKGRGTVVSGARLFLDDVILYRYADILLMKAEVKNALGQDPSDEINRVRQRAYGESFSEHTFVSGSQEENDEAILNERLLELAFEGKRWWDLLRFGKAIEMIPTLQSKDDPEHLLLFPISNTVLSLEPLIEQNSGYSSIN